MQEKSKYREVHRWAKINDDVELINQLMNLTCFVAVSAAVLYVLHSNIHSLPNRNSYTVIIRRSRSKLAIDAVVRWSNDSRASKHNAPNQ